MIVEILRTITKLTIDLYFDTLTIIKTVSTETRDKMTQMPSTNCTEDAINRWDRRVLSYINTDLNYCLRERYLNMCFVQEIQRC